MAGTESAARLITADGTPAGIARDSAVFYSEQAAAAFAADPPDPELGLYLADAVTYWTRAASSALAAALVRAERARAVLRPEAGER